MPFSALIITDVLINQAGSYYTYSNTQMTSLLLHSTLALPQYHVITTIDIILVMGYNYLPSQDKVSIPS